MRGRAASLLLMLLPAGLAAQSLTITPDVPRALVGDEVTLSVTVTLLPEQELLDLVPRNLFPPPSGTRVLHVDTLRKTGPLEYRGKIRMTWFRVGPQPVPTFSLLYRPEPKALPDTLVHAPVAMEIASLLPAGNPSLKDIKPLLPIGGPVWAQLAFLAALVSAGFGWLWYKGRPKRRVVVPEPEPALDPGPFVRALERLDQLEAEAIASGNGVVPLYGDVAAILRKCLVEIGALPHLGLTTPETPVRLPAPLRQRGAADRLHGVLRDADLVKFAAVRPDLGTAREHLQAARALLGDWRAVAQASEASSAPEGDA
jgi:hypothetical protein